MKERSILLITSLLTLVLLTAHLAGDIVYGYEKGGLSNLIAIPIVVAWLYAALLLAERRSGYIITLLFALLSLGVPVIHMSGKGVGLASRMANSNGHFLFVFALLAIGVTSLMSVILAVRGLWTLRRREPR